MFATGLFIRGYLALVLSALPASKAVAPTRHGKSGDDGEASACMHVGRGVCQDGGMFLRSRAGTDSLSDCISSCQSDADCGFVSYCPPSNSYCAVSYWIPGACSRYEKKTPCRAVGDLLRSTAVQQAYSTYAVSQDCQVQDEESQATHIFKPGKMGITYDDKGLIKEVNLYSPAYIHRISKGDQIVNVGGEQFSINAVAEAEKSGAAYNVTVLRARGDVGSDKVKKVAAAVMGHNKNSNKNQKGRTRQLLRRVPPSIGDPSSFNEVVNATRLHDIGCPFVKSVENDYNHVAWILDFLKKSGRPFFLQGGNAMNLLRFGALRLQHPSGDPFIAFDDDLDFVVYSVDEAARRAFAQDLMRACQKANIFRLCSFPFRVAWDWQHPDSSFERPDGGMVSNLADFYDLRDYNATHMAIINYGKPGRHWLIHREVLLPLQPAKYYDLKVPVPGNALKYFSESLFWIVDGSRSRCPKYGAGCNGMAYPPFVVERFTTDVAEARPMAIRLEHCAKSLKKNGYASFAECVKPGFYLGLNDGGQREWKKDCSLQNEVYGSIPVAHFADMLPSAAAATAAPPQSRFSFVNKHSRLKRHRRPKRHRVRKLFAHSSHVARVKKEFGPDPWHHEITTDREPNAEMNKSYEQMSPLEQQMSPPITMQMKPAEEQSRTLEQLKRSRWSRMRKRWWPSRTSRHPSHGSNLQD